MADEYLTGRRLRALDLGLDLSVISDQAIASAISRARSATDRYCNVPLIPARHSFHGGTIVDERHAWIDTEARRIYPFHYPVKDASYLRIDATNTLFIEFQTTELYVQPTEGYVEIINFSISKVGIWNVGGLPSFGLAQPVGRINYTYGYDFLVEDEELQSTTNSGEYMADNGYWDPNLPITIKQDDVTLLSSAYDLDTKSGMLVLNTPDPTKTVTASYTYHCPHDIQEAQGIITIDRLVKRKYQAFEGFDEFQVEELRLARQRRVRAAPGADMSDIPESAKDLLGDFVFQTMR